MTHTAVSTRPSHQRPLSLFWIALGFIAAQRFTAPWLANYICLAPLLGALLSFRKTKTAERNSYLIIALFFCTDYSLPEIPETSAVVRYAIYIAALICLFVGTKPARASLVILAILSIFYISKGILQSTELSASQFTRDVLILILVIAVAACKPRGRFQIRFDLLVPPISGYLFAELINFFAYRELWRGEYLSFNSTRYLIIIPSIYALITLRANRPLLAYALIAITVVVLVGYTTRAIFISYFFCLLFAYAFLKRSPRLTAPWVLGAAIGVAVLTLDNSKVMELFSQYKALDMLVILTRGGDVFSNLDPVRSASSQMFFSLPLSEILFGRGFGSGVDDRFGLLNFVQPGTAAFSDHELSNGVFYNFHDIWVDVGLRFGLVPMAFFFGWFFMQYPRRSREGGAAWLISFVGLLVGYYSVASLLTAFIFLRAVIAEGAHNRQTR
jgi:hypothetical protein